MRKVWYVYILRCADDTLYTGITNFLKRRVETHNRQKGARYTRTRTPVKLVYSEKQPSCGAALKREAYIKTFSPKRKKNSSAAAADASPSNQNGAVQNKVWPF